MGILLSADTALATDHTKEALKSEIGFLDMGLNLGCTYKGGVPLRGAPGTEGEC